MLLEPERMPTIIIEPFTAVTAPTERVQGVVPAETPKPLDIAKSICGPVGCQNQK